MSYSFGVYYIRNVGAADELRGRFGRVEAAGAEWIACDFGDSTQPDEAFGDDRADPGVFASEALSRRFGEAIYVFVDSHADELIYDHGRGGELVRKLLWTSDGLLCSWECVAGTPEPWEDALFAAHNLTNALSAAEPEEHDEIRAIYADRRISSGARWPTCDATVAELIERHFGITRPAPARRR